MTKSEAEIFIALKDRKASVGTFMNIISAVIQK